MRSITLKIFAVALFGLVPLAAAAQDCPEDSLRVGYHQFPGVITLDEVSGEPVGLAVDLLQELRVSEGQELCFVEYPVFGSIFNEGGVNDVDLMAGAFTINQTREAAYDFSMPFMNAGVGILVPNEGGGISFWGLITGLINPITLQGFLFLIGLIVTGGIVLWICERKDDRGIANNAADGIRDGIYCIQDSITTIGYGRAEPRTLIGRVLVLILFFVGYVPMSMISGQITTAMTVSELETSINSPADLRGRIVATKAGTSNVALLQRLGAEVYEVSSREATVEALRDGKVEAVVYDAPYLQFESANDEDLLVSATFSPQHYGFAMPTGSELRDPLNSVLLKMWGDGSIDRLTTQYFGK